MDAALKRLSTRPMSPRIPRETLLSQVKQALDHPESVDQGLHPHMCVPAVLQGYLAETQPEDFVELVGDLASPVGEAQTASGAKLFRIEDALEDDGTDRNLMERLVQAAIFDGAERAAGALRGQYSSLHHTNNGNEAQGLGAWQTEQMLKQLTGDDSWTKSTPSLHTLDKACEEEPVPVVLRTGKGRGHQMLLLDIDQGTAQLRDPEGEFAHPFEGATIRETGVQSMPVETLEKVLSKAYLKAEQLPPEDRDPSTWILG